MKQTDRQIKLGELYSRRLKLHYELHLKYNPLDMYCDGKQEEIRKIDKEIADMGIIEN